MDNDEITKNIKALKLQGSPRGKGGRKQPSPSRTVSSPSAEKKKSQKQMRVWDGQIAKGEMEALDYSGGGGDDTVDEASIKAQHFDTSKLGTKNKQGIYEVQDVDVPDDEDDDEDYDFGDDEDDATTNTKQGGIFSFFKSMTGQREMTAETLDPVLATMKDSMIDKNVGKEIADRLCESVKSSLLGKKLGSFERKWIKNTDRMYHWLSLFFFFFFGIGVSAVVRASMESALKRILTPKTSLDILRDIEQAKSEKRPYVITFIGVNGVGKVS